MDDLRDDFIAETRETLEVLASQLVAWEKQPGDHELIDSVFRFVHTVKGSCGFLDLPRLLRLSHAAEDLMSVARDDRLEVNAGLVTAVLAVIDRIAELTEALESGSSAFDDDMALIDAMMAYHPDNAGFKADTAEALVVIEKTPVEQETTDPVAAKNRTVRVSLRQLDKLMNGISDLVLARNELSRQLRVQGISNDLDMAFGRLSTSVADIRDSIGTIRMQHIDRLFASVPRLLRDICVDLGKQIEFSIDGGEVELDREMVESLRDPLIHIIRNAADHGIELPAERQSVGKDPVGHIHISARQAGNQIIIEISDDGRGVDLDELGKRVVARNIAPLKAWQQMDEAEKLAMIFTPGLSTAQNVTAISGRGVGMDVVRTNLDAIGAKIDLKNSRGQGFTIALRLPLTLSILAGLSVRAGEQMFALPRSTIVEILSISSAHVKIESIGGATMAKVRDERLAYARLEDVLGIQTSDSSLSARTLVLIRSSLGVVFALDVEAVVDTEELVVKPCAPLIMATGLYAGTTLPDSGKPMLLLDTNGIAAAIGATKSIATKQVIEKEGSDQPLDAGGECISVLVFVGIDGKRQALPLAIIERMEDIDAKQITAVDGRMFILAEGKTYVLLGLDEMPTSGLTNVLKLTDGNSTKFLAVEDVLDIHSVVPDRTLGSPFGAIEGLVQIDGKLIELLSAFSLFADNGAANLAVNRRPLCMVHTENNEGWAQNILRPLLIASGYDVSFDAADRARSDIVIEGDAGSGEGFDPRAIHLRDQPVADQDGHSIYRYDRLSLLTAIEARMTGKG
jgi:two-component system, chemotaxis family, sensor kinase CheA